MATNDWGSWLSQFVPQVGAPQWGNALNSPANGPSLGRVSVGAPQPQNIINSPAQGPTLGRIGLPHWLGGQGLYTPPGPQGPPPQQGPGGPNPNFPPNASAPPMPLQGATPPSPVGTSTPNSGTWNWPSNPFQDSMGGWGGPSSATAAAPGSPSAAPAPYAGGGIGGDWRYPTAAAPGTGGIGSDARFPLAATPPGTPSATPRPAGQGGIGSDAVASRVKPATPTAAAKPVVPNLGYYRPSVGNARGATFMPAGATGAPPIFRGPLAQGAGKDYYGGFFG